MSRALLALVGALGTSEWIDTLPEVNADDVRTGITLGTVVNQRGPDGALVPIPDDVEYSGAFLKPPLPCARIDADTLTEILRSYSDRSRDSTGYSPLGMCLREVIVIGTLNLNSLDLGFPLRFEGCIFTSAVAVDYFNAPMLDFDTCAFLGGELYSASISGTRAVISQRLRLFQCGGLRQLFLPDATIGALQLTEDTVDFAPGEAQAFRTVLSDASISSLELGGADPLAIVPAGDAAGLRVGALELSDLGDWEPAPWLAAWLSGGVPPRRGGPLAPWTSGRGISHHRDTWASFARALGASSDTTPTMFGTRDESRRLLWLAERHRDSYASSPVRLWRWLWLDITVRYFLENVRALWWLIGVWLVVATVAWLQIADLYRGAASAPEGPLVAGSEGVAWALGYGLNFVVSPLSIGFDGVWPANPWLVLLFAALKLAALVLFSLFVVGISGITQRAGSRS